MITLPKEPLPAVVNLTGNNILITGDYGIGKSGLLASTGYLLADPEDKLRAYPNLLRVSLKTWQDHKDFVSAVAKEKPGTFQGIGLDSLNISYDQALTWVMKNVKFAGSWLTHPSENPQIAYPRVTHEFVTWLREVTLLGYHVIATCHVNIVEIRDKKGAIYNRWVPAFTGGSPTSTYSAVLKTFPIVGFMTIDDVAVEPDKPKLKPSTRLVMGKQVPDVRVDSTRLPDADSKTEQRHVIYFRQDPNWLANNKFGGFPDRVVLTEDWRDDWRLLQEAWNSESHEETDEPIETSPEKTAVPAGTKKAGLGHGRNK